MTTTIIGGDDHEFDDENDSARTSPRSGHRDESGSDQISPSTAKDAGHGGSDGRRMDGGEGELDFIDELLQAQNGEAVSLVLQHRITGSLPLPETMMGYRNVDPSIPDKIISMSERRLDAEVDNRKRLTIADALSVAFASIGTTILPWIVCIVGIVYGQNAAAILGGAAGVVTVGSTIIRSIREAKNNDSNDME